ncbi:hypothetical protein ACVII1_009208 [Bradyrhizobium elkanii]
MAFTGVAAALSSPEVSSALALATVAGMPAEVTLPASLPVAFLLSDLSAVLEDWRRAWRRPCRGLCCADLSVVALSDFDADVSEPAACAGSGPRETYEKPCQSCRNHQCQAPAGFDLHFDDLPMSPAQGRKETPLRVHTGAEKGNLRASGGKSWAISS